MPLSGYDDLDFCWYFIISNYQNVYCEHTKLATPGGSDGKTSACNEGDPGSIPGSGRSPGEGNGYPPVFLLGESHGQKSLGGFIEFTGSQRIRHN